MYGIEDPRLILKCAFIAGLAALTETETLASLAQFIAGDLTLKSDEKN
jgi:hypothetical protein